MKTQIKQWADSKVLVLPADFIKFMDLKVGDWVDLSDITKVKQNETN